MSNEEVRQDDEGKYYIMRNSVKDAAVASDGRFFLLPMVRWNMFHDHPEELIVIHDCPDTNLEPFFISWPVTQKCINCGYKASDKIQTLYALHNGHY